MNYNHSKRRHRSEGERASVNSTPSFFFFSFVKTRNEETLSRPRQEKAYSQISPPVLEHFSQWKESRTSKMSEDQASSAFSVSLLLSGKHFDEVAVMRIKADALTTTCTRDVHTLGEKKMDLLTDTATSRKTQPGEFLWGYV